MMREAVFFPTPGIRCTAATSWAAMAAASPEGVKAESAANATLGPTPLTPMSFSNSVFSSSERKPNSDMPSSRTCR